ncbi:MAG: DNRLRE domain-containing protein, partial [Clostridia bacterium]|nr:DNRLRE domain-containing protein [Clostridia bacterium]
MPKTKKTIVTKVISFILSMLILFYAVPSVVYAETIDALSNLGSDESSISVENSSSGADFKLPMYEVEELREENVKHFKLSDGSYVAAQYNYPVHYEDENGRLLDIDNALSDASGGVYANKNARVKFAKKITGNESLFTLHDGNTKITLSLIGAEKGTKGAVTNREDSKEDTELQKMMNLENLTSSVIYKDILDGTDLEYVVESLNIKENIIVKEKKDEYVYTFEIKLNGLTAALTDSGDIKITDVSSEEVKYVIPAPVIYDAEGIYAESGVGSYTLSDGGNGKYTLVVSVSGEWMNSAERAFPVTVDPTVKVSNSNVIDLTISSSTPDTVSESDIHLVVATGTVAYWKTSSLPTLPAGAYITAGYIEMRSAGATGSSKYVCAHEVLTAWNPNIITWNSHNDATNPVGKLADVATDYNALDSNICSWNITPIVRNWYSGSNANKGVAFKKASESSGTITFYSSEAAEHYRPSLTIAYSNMSGVEDYWSYSSHSIGVAGSGSINLASGYLTLAIPTLSTTDSLMPFTPTLVYNSAMANKDYVYANTQTANTVDYMPLGFKLNICETLIKKYYTDTDEEETFYYVYADA